MMIMMMKIDVLGSVAYRYVPVLLKKIQKKKKKSIIVTSAAYLT